MWPGFLILIAGIRRWLANEGGQDLVEYALLVCLIGAVATATSQAMAYVLTQSLKNIAAEFLNLV